MSSLDFLVVESLPGLGTVFTWQRERAKLRPKSTVYSPI